MVLRSTSEAELNTLVARTRDGARDFARAKLEDKIGWLADAATRLVLARKDRRGIDPLGIRRRDGPGASPDRGMRGAGILLVSRD